MLFIRRCSRSFSYLLQGMAGSSMPAILGPAKIGICLEFSRDFANFEGVRVV